MNKFNIALNGKHIESVWYGLKGTRKEQEDQVKNSLINHDGYDSAITVRLVGRLTEDEYELQGNYGHGWECLTAETTYSEIKARRKEYRENEGGTYRIVLKRVRKEI